MSQAAAHPFVALPVVESWDETARLRAITLDLGAHGAAHHVPGQVVRVRTPAGDGYFALSNAPDSSARAEILVRRGAPMAESLVEAARPGAQLEVTAPFGRGFPIDKAANHDVLLFAAGSGISPIRSVLQKIVRERPHYRRVALFYGERSDDDFAFIREHASWHDVDVCLCASRPSETWSGARGHVQDVARARSFAQIAADSAVAFLCGMKTMVHAVREALVAHGIPAERTFLNH
jgi:ferredoxin-NADP reductase